MLTNARTGVPVGPFAMNADSPSRYAVPAMSRWIHGVSPTKFLRNAPAVSAPAGRPPVFLRSAMSLLICWSKSG